MLSLLTAGIGMVRTVANKYCVWCNSYTKEFEEVRHIHDIIFSGCKSCVKRVCDELQREKSNGKHAA